MRNRRLRWLGTSLFALSFAAACGSSTRTPPPDAGPVEPEAGPLAVDTRPALADSAANADTQPPPPDTRPPSPDARPPSGDTSLPSPDGNSPPAEAGTLPDLGTAPPPDKLAKLCGQRQAELATALCPAGDAECASGCTYFFSSSLGSDSLDGKAPAPSGASGPWKSLSKLQGLALQAGDAVCFRRGDTFRGSAQLPYGLRAPASKPIVLRPYGPPAAPRPVLSGAKTIPTAWTPVPSSPKLMQIDLTSTLARGPAYQRQGKSYTPREKIYQLFATGEPQRLATFPNPGEGASIAKGLKLPAGHYSLIDAVPGGGRIRDAELPSTNALTGAAIDWTGARFYHRQIRWIIDAFDVTAFDAATRTLTLSGTPDCATDDCVGWGYFLIDHLGALDSPGEWYYDDATQILYFYPPAGLDLATTELEASVYTADAQPPSWESPSTLPEPAFTTGLDLQSGSGLRVYCLVFQHFSSVGVRSVSTIGTGSADAPESTTDLRIEGCAFHHTGPTGVTLERWVDIAGTDGKNRLTGNTFVGQTSHAVILQTTHSEIACNTVDDVGLLEHYPRFGMFGSGQAPSEHGMAVYVTAGNVDIVYNRVRRTASAGISFRGPATTVAYNLVRQACYTKSDCGGVHTFTWPDDGSGFADTGITGSTVMNNIVLESIGSSEGDGRDYDTPMAQGLFLDFGSHDYVVKGNVVALSTTAGILLARNRNVTVEGNTLYANVQDSEWNYPFSQIQLETSYPPTLAQLRGNVVVAVAPLQIPLGIRGMTIAEAGTFDGNTYFDPFAYDATSAEHALTNYLIFVAPDDEATRVGYHLREWASLAKETNAAGAPFYWHADRIAEELSANLIANGTFDTGLAGWTTESWSASTVTADPHPVLGPSLRFDRNGAQGGGIGVKSNSFALEAGQTYWLRLWLAPADGVTVPLPPAVNFGDPDDWVYLPSDRTREISFVFTPRTTQSKAALEITPYPLHADRFWIDDVSVKKVTALPYDQGTAIRFDEPVPTGVRSFLTYNDTDTEQPLALGAAVYVDPAGTRHTGSVTVPAFGGVILFPEAWTKAPSK